LDLGDVVAEIVGASEKYSLVARNVPTEGEARALVPRLAEALRRLALETGWSIEVSETIQQLKDLGETDTATVDSPGLRYFGDWAFAVVYSDDQSVALEAAGEVRTLQTMSSGNAAEKIRAAMEAGAARPRDERLRLGMDLFIDAGFHEDPYGAFLLRVTALEVLAETPRHAEVVQDAISRWKREVAELDRFGQTDDVRNSLIGSLNYLRKRSISRSVQELVRGEIGPEEAKRAEELYTLRSGMVHDGSVPERGALITALQELTEIVKTVLIRRLSKDDALT
jgi:hypothetical protein